MGRARGRRGARTRRGAAALPALVAGLLCAGAAGVGLAPPPLGAQTTAIVNGEVHPVSGPVIERGTVLIRDGLIVEVGEDVEVPGDARVIEAEGRIVTPGLLESVSRLGIVELGVEPGPADARTTEERITASFDVLDGINPHATAIPVTRVAGVTRAVVVPEPGSAPIGGQGALIDLSGRELERIVHRSPAGMFGVLGEPASALAGGARGAATRWIREAFEDARDLAENRAAFEDRERRSYALGRPDLEALGPVLDGEVPFVLRAHRASDILVALRLADEFDLELVLVGAAEGWMVAERIREADVPVILDPMTNLPGFEQLGATLENAARLHEAGVRVVLSSFETANARNLTQAAGNAVAHGMPHDAALRAVTLAPAEVWGVGAEVGSLEPGKEADVVVWSGDPFELRTHAERVFIRGLEVSPETRQRLLFERYRILP